MNLYFDCEFTGLHKNTTLISLGIVAENDKKFYAEFSDYERKQVDSWIAENVLNHLYLSGIPWHTAADDRISKLKSDGYEISKQPYIATSNSVLEYYTKHETDDGITEVYGDCAWVSVCLEEWLSNFDKIQFISDVCHYDFVLLIDLFGAAFNLPEYISPYCHDINQDIASHYHISDAEAFDKSREHIVSEVSGELPKGNKHNALYDAEVIKTIYEGISDLRS